MGVTEELREFLRGYPPEYAEAITGLPKEEIIAAAREYATAERASIIYTLGITKHTHGVYNVQSLANIALLTGNLGIANAGVNPLRGQNNVQGAGDMAALPNYLPGYERHQDDVARGRWEGVWGVKLDPKPGVTKLTAIDEILEGKIRAVWIMGENPLVSDANMEKTRRAFNALNLLVVQELFMTETAEMAYIVLPSTSFAEVDGTYTNTERRVQRIRKAIDPPGEALPDWMPFVEIANRMGTPCPTTAPRRSGTRWRRTHPSWPESPMHALRSSAFNGPAPRWIIPVRPSYTKASLSPAGVLSRRLPWSLWRSRPMRSTTLVLTTDRRRSTYHTGTQTRRVEGFEVLVPHELLEVSPEDAVDLLLDDGDEAEITSHRGTLTVPVKITDRSPMGVVFMSFHFPDKVLTNLLTTDSHDPTTHTAEYKACAVRIRKAGMAVGA